MWLIVHVIKCNEFISFFIIFKNMMNGPVLPWFIFVFWCSSLLPKALYIFQFASASWMTNFFKPHRIFLFFLFLSLVKAVTKSDHHCFHLNSYRLRTVMAIFHVWVCPYIKTDKRTPGPSKVVRQYVYQRSSRIRRVSSVYRLHCFCGRSNVFISRWLRWRNCEEGKLFGFIDQVKLSMI